MHKPRRMDQIHVYCRDDRINAPYAPLLPAEHHELMSQHEQLDLFGELAAPASDQQPQQNREGEIGERKEHALDGPIARYRAQDEQERRSWTSVQ